MTINKDWLDLVNWHWERFYPHQQPITETELQAASAKKLSPHPATEYIAMQRMIAEGFREQQNVR